MDIKMYVCPIALDEVVTPTGSIYNRRLDIEHKVLIEGEIKKFEHSTLSKRKDRTLGGVLKVLSVETFTEAFDEKLKMEKLDIVGVFEKKDRIDIRNWAREYKDSMNISQYVDAYDAAKGAFGKAKNLNNQLNGKEKKSGSYDFQSDLTDQAKANASGLLKATEAQEKKLLNKAIIIEFIKSEDGNENKETEQKIYNNCSVISYTETFTKGIKVDGNNKKEEDKIEISLSLLNKSEYINM